MINAESLKNMEETDIRKVQKESLVDIKNVVIDKTKKRTERISDYVRQIKNPYCFVCEGIIVKINFEQTEDTLENKLNHYFLSL